MTIQSMLRMSFREEIKMKKSKLVTLFLITIIASFTLIACQSIGNNKRVFEIARADIYSELMDKSYLKQIDMKQNTPSYKMNLEDYYYDKNIIAFTINMDYWDKNADKFSPFITISDKYVHDSIILSYDDDYLCIIPAEIINQGDVIRVLMRKNETGGYVEFQAHKTVSDDAVQEVTLFDNDSKQTIGRLSVSPFGTILQMADEVELVENSNYYTLTQTDETEIKADYVFNNSLYILGFNEKLKFSDENKDAEKLLFRQYQVKADSKVLLDEKECYVK